MSRSSVAAALVTLAVSLFGSASAHAQDAPYDAVIERFFGLVQQGQVDEAIEFLYSSNPWIARSPDAVGNVRRRLKELPSLMGELRHHERLQTKALGTRFVYLSYLAAYERQPMRFVFEFYKPDEQWMTFGFLFDAELDENVEEAARRELGSDR